MKALVYTGLHMVLAYVPADCGETLVGLWVFSGTVVYDGEGMYISSEFVSLT